MNRTTLIYTMDTFSIILKYAHPQDFVAISMVCRDWRAWLAEWRGWSEDGYDAVIYGDMYQLHYLLPADMDVFIDICRIGAPKLLRAVLRNMDEITRVHHEIILDSSNIEHIIPAVMDHPSIDLSIFNNDFLCKAILYCDYKIVKYIWERSEITDDNKSIVYAYRYNKAILEQMLDDPRTPLSYNDYEILQLASGDCNVFKKIMRHPTMKHVLIQINETFGIDIEKMLDSPAFNSGHGNTARYNACRAVHHCVLAVTSGRTITCADTGEVAARSGAKVYRDDDYDDYCDYDD